MNPLEKWKEIFKTKRFKDLNTIVSEDTVFFSPVVHTPQKGKSLVIKYLSSAIEVFENSNFTYVNEIKLNNEAFLEFKCVLNKLEINGIDYVKYDTRRIILFKVFIRPQKALNQVWLEMSKKLSLQ